MSGVFREVFSVISKRGWWLVALNWLFFGSVVVGGFLAQAGLFGVSFWPFGDVSSFKSGNAFLLFGVIFLFNLVLSGFVFLTLSGLVFFVLSPIVLGFRALLWGVLLNGLSTSSFVAALPTIVLEGEGYAFAALGGLVLGLSWLRPKLIYGDAEGLSRMESVKKALRETAGTYAFVFVFLLVAAIVETITLVYV